MDGMEAVQRIRQYEIEHDIPSIPIVGLTADIQIEVHHQCVLAGMTTCFAKPVILRNSYFIFFFCLVFSYYFYF